MSDATENDWQGTGDVETDSSVLSDAEGAGVGTEEVISETTVEETTSEEKPQFWTQKMGEDERAKRQGLKLENQDLKERLARLEGRLDSKPEKKPEKRDYSTGIDWGALPETIPATMGQMLDDRDASNAEKRATEKLESERLRIDVGVEVARDTHEDFDTVIPVWNDAVKNNPNLAVRASHAAQPVEYAYRWAKKNAPVDKSEMQKLRDENAALQKQLSGQPPPKSRASVASVTGGSTKPGKAGGSSGSVLDDAHNGR